MTDGTSQGLFIVVAIVIFGIFTVLAYILFEDTLSPAMATMFDSAIVKSEEELEHKGKLISRSDSSYKSFYSQILGGTEEGTFLLKWDGYSSEEWWGDRLPVGLTPTERVKIAWGQKMVVTFDVLISVDADLTVDLNATPKEGASGNDNYGTRTPPTAMGNIFPLKANEKTKITYFLVNDNEVKNPNKYDIYEHTNFGIQQKYLMNGETFEISNIKYYVTKYLK